MSRLGILFFAFFTSTSALSGGVETHGGPTVVCRTRDGAKKIISAVMLDFFEARNIRGLPVSVKRSGTPEEIALKTLDRLQAFPDYARRFQVELEGIVSSQVTMEPGVKIEPTNDIYPVIRQEGCAIELAAIYLTSERRIVVDEEIFGAMDATNRAALYVHETTYLIDRQETETRSSVNARKLTGYLFADTVKSTEIAELVNRQRVSSEIWRSFVPAENSPDDPKTCVVAFASLYMNGDEIEVQASASCEKEIKTCAGIYSMNDSRLWKRLSSGPTCAVVWDENYAERSDFILRSESGDFAFTWR